MPDIFAWKGLTSGKVHPSDETVCNLTVRNRCLRIAFSTLLSAFDDAFGARVGAEIERIAIAERVELFCSDGAASARMAVQKNWLVFVRHAGRERGFDLVDGEVDGCGQVARVEFSGSADIHDQSAFAQAFMCVFHRNLAGPPEENVGEREDGNEGDESPFHPFRLTPQILRGSPMRGLPISGFRGADSAGSRPQAFATSTRVE